MKKIYFLLGAIVLSSLLLSGCSTKINQDNHDKLSVMVSILPQIDFVERIGGNKVTVEAMIPIGFSPATYEPSPEQMKKLSKADLYIRIGHIPFEEAQMDNLIDINPDMIVLDSSLGVDLRSLEAHSHEDNHEHGDEHEEGDDPHIWLDPNLVKIQAENIYQALVDISPADKDYFTANKETFLNDLDQLDATLIEAFQPIADQTILVFHPAFGYLADAYGFYQEAIEIEGKDPTIEALQTIIDEAKEDNVKVIFVQKQFSTESAQVVADAIDGAVVQIDPLAQDYFANLSDMAYTIIDNMQ